MPVAPRPPDRGIPEQTPVPESSGVGKSARDEAAKNQPFSRFFDWLGKIIMDEAKVETWNDDHLPPLTALHEITLRQQRTEEVVETAKNVCADLEEVEKRLSLEFGSKAASFISKCIHPMIIHAKELIADLTTESNKDDSYSSLLEKAIESVELYSQFSDESRLKRKIVEDAQVFIRQTIEKDMEMLQNYKKHALDKAEISTSEKKERAKLIDRFLYPIFSELKGMAISKVETDDLHAFFIWKTSVDDRRNALVELAFLTTDGLVGDSEPVEPEDEESSFGISEVEQKLQEYAYILSILSHLESQAAEFIIHLENLPEGDFETLLLIEQLLIDLKNESNGFTALPVDSIKIRNDFVQLQKSIQRAEGLLQAHKEKY
jgi:hypothetical protein